MQPSIPAPPTATTPGASPVTSDDPDPGARSALTRRRAQLPCTPVLLPVVVGLVLGPLDLLLQHVLPYPFANLANSPATWALVAFAIGWFLRSRRRWWPAAAGTIALLLAVESYYASAVLALGDDVATLTDGAALLWLALAVGAGVVFGTAGSWARSGHRWRGPVGTATTVGVLLAEAGSDVVRAAGAGDDVTYRNDLVQTAVVLLVLAAAAAVLAGRSARQRITGAALALVVALVGAIAYSTVLR